MSALKKAFISIIVISFCVQIPVWGQPSRTGKHPSAVLVQLRAERNRINALIKARKYDELETFKTDANKVMMAMISDFRDNFTHCPVYYYMDTNFDAVMARKFEGVLLDDHLLHVTNTVLGDTSTDYLIVYYGYPNWQTRNKAGDNSKWDTTRAKDIGGSPAGRGLVINDYRFRQLSYISRIDFDFFNFRKKHAKNPYRYESKKFDLVYTPSAAELSRNLPYRSN